MTNLYVLINCDLMQFVATGDYRALAAQADSQIPEASYLIGEAQNEFTYRDFNERDLRRLYESAMQGIPPIPGKQPPTKWELPKLCMALAVKAPATGHKAPVEPAQAPPMRVSSDAAPINSSQHGSQRPKAGTSTGRVWEIADALRAADPSVDFEGKPFREEVIKKCEAENINPSTAQVQLSKWKKEQ